jgi:hypothetical protein
MKGKAIGIVIVVALLVGLTIGSSMAETLFYYPVPGETWMASTKMWGTGSSHTSKTITLGDANIDEIGVEGWLYHNGATQEWTFGTLLALILQKQTIPSRLPLTGGTQAPLTHSTSDSN